MCHFRIFEPLQTGDSSHHGEVPGPELDFSGKFRLHLGEVPGPKWWFKGMEKSTSKKCPARIQVEKMFSQDGNCLPAWFSLIQLT